MNDDVFKREAKDYSFKQFFLQCFSIWILLIVVAYVVIVVLAQFVKLSSCQNEYQAEDEETERRKRRSGSPKCVRYEIIFGYILQVFKRASSMGRQQTDGESTKAFKNDVVVGGKRARIMASKIRTVFSPQEGVNECATRVTNAEPAGT